MAEASRIFISYARRDGSAFAQELLNGLEVAGFEPFLDRHDIAAGEDWELRLGGLIQSADTVVFVVSPAAVASERCAWELNKAEGLSKRIIPVVLIDVPEAQTPVGLKRLNYIFFTQGHSFSLALKELATALRIDLDWIREHTRLAELARRWRDRNQSSALLLRGAELNAARAWLANWRAGAPEPTDLHRAFINESEREEGALLKLERERLWQQSRLQRRFGIAVLVASIVTAISGWAVVEGQRNLGRSQSLMLSRVADQFYAQSDFVRGMRVAVLAANDRFLSPAAPEAADTLASNAANSFLELEILGVSGADFSNNGSRIRAWDEKGAERLFDAATGAQIELHRLDGSFRDGVFSRDGSRVLTWSDNAAQQWKAATREPIGQPLTHEGRVIGATFSHDEKRILSWSEDGTARLWDAVNGTQIGQPFKNEGWVNGALFSKDDTRILTWSWNFFASPIAQLWNVATGTPITEFRHPSDGLIYGAMFMSDESRILTWGHDGTARLWNVTTGMQDGPPFTHGGAVLGAISSKDDSRILSWSEDGTARLWARPEKQYGAPIVSSGEQIPIAPSLTHNGRVSGAVFSRDESRILTWGQDGTARLWDTRGRQLSVYRHDGPVGGAVFSPDQSRILTWSKGTVRLWNAEGVQIDPSLEHGLSVGGAAFSQDESRVLTSGDRSARLLDVKSTALRMSNAALVQEVCAAKLVPAAVSRLDATDIQAAIILRGREGEDVCPYLTFFGRLLDALRLGH